MKIAYVLSSLDNLGPFIVAQTLAQRLKNKVAKIDVFYIDDKVSLVFEVDTKKVSLFSRNINFDKYDICHSHGLKADLFIYLHRHCIQGKCVTTLHQYNGEQLKYYYSNIVVAKIVEVLWKMILSRHDLVIALSKHMKSYYNQNFNNKILTDFVYNGRDIIENHFEIPESERNTLQNIYERFTVIGSVSHIVKRKGIDQLIRVLKKDESLFLLVVGDGAERENLINLAKELNVNQRCMFLGYKKHCLAYYKYFHIYGMTSHAEGFPLVLIEAAAMKVPAICSDIEMFHELFTENEVSYFKINDIDSLYDSVQKIRNNPITYINSFHRKYKNNFTAAKMAEGYLNIYNRLINN